MTLTAQGKQIGVRTTIDLEPATGIIMLNSDDGERIAIGVAVDTAYLSTIYGTRDSGSNFCDSIIAPGGGFTCNLNPPLQAPYVRGLVIRWVPPMDGSGQTLNVDTIGSAPLTEADGVTALSYSAGQLVQLWYDGSKWRRI